MSNPRFIVTGTDTDIGKTVFAAMLVQALDGYYHKPVQAGVEDGTDTKTVRAITSLPADRFIPETYVLNTPASPHLSAEIDGMEIDVSVLTPPSMDRPLIIEGAGGLLVPLTRQTLLIDAFGAWDAGVILCARTALGTINHTLLSIEALKQRQLPIVGVAFVGDENKDSERTITEMGGVRRLGRLPRLPEMTPKSLSIAFNKNFSMDDFAQAG